MLNISFGEFFVFAIIALIVLGPEKLPQTIRTVLLKYRNLRNVLDKVQQDFENELELAELKKLMNEELEKIKKNEDELKSQLHQMQLEIDSFNQEFNTSDEFQKHPIKYTYLQNVQLHVPYQKADTCPNFEVKKVA